MDLQPGVAALEKRDFAAAFLPEVHNRASLQPLYKRGLVVAVVAGAGVEV